MWLPQKQDVRCRHRLDLSIGICQDLTTTRSCSISLDVDPQEAHVLAGVSSGGAALVALGKLESKGNIEMMYSLTKESDGWAGRNEYGAALATQGQAVLFGTVDSCALVWDRKKGNVVYGLEHDEGQFQAVRLS